MRFLAGLPLWGAPERQNLSRQFVQRTKERARYAIDRRSALIFLFSAFVPVVPILGQKTPKMPGAETGAKFFGAPEVTAAKFTDVTAALGLDFRNLASHTLKKYKPSAAVTSVNFARSEEHTSELQSPCNLVCRL